ncbi:MAG TPA: hypothetical protein VI612_01520 [Candidatus Nanoarchaeia archaeon]|nr:hypothetical protein [Candidatus Nanoarchaeia archaeon]
MMATQMKNALIALSFALLLLASCAPRAVPQVIPIAPDTPVGTEQAITDIESSMSEADALDMEFDTSSLDALEADLAELDKLDLG